eukprot:363781-Chlamydomonas_euryale.AAC.25
MLGEFRSARLAATMRPDAAGSPFPLPGLRLAAPYGDADAGRAAPCLPPPLPRAVICTSMWPSGAAPGAGAGNSAPVDGGTLAGRGGADRGRTTAAAVAPPAAAPALLLPGPLHGCDPATGSIRKSCAISCSANSHGCMRSPVSVCAVRECMRSKLSVCAVRETKVGRPPTSSLPSSSWTFMSLSLLLSAAAAGTAVGTLINAGAAPASAAAVGSTLRSSDACAADSAKLRALKLSLEATSGSARSPGLRAVIPAGSPPLRLPRVESSWLAADSARLPSSASLPATGSATLLVRCSPADGAATGASPVPSTGAPPPSSKVLPSSE